MAGARGAAPNRLKPHYADALSLLTTDPIVVQCDCRRDESLCYSANGRLAEG